ncbi:Uncharacterised protein [Mycobacteroides abscessus subsp. abscessus]|nr:Uncharacterised protein [Mycobacteroides abscessus subsp. abscessus]
MLGNEEIGVIHAEWIQDPLTQERVQRQTGRTGDEQAQHIGGMAVVEALAGWVHQW